MSLFDALLAFAKQNYPNPNEHMIQGIVEVCKDEGVTEYDTFQAFKNCVKSKPSFLPKPFEVLESAQDQTAKARPEIDTEKCMKRMRDWVDYVGFLHDRNWKLLCEYIDHDARKQSVLWQGYNSGDQDVWNKIFDLGGEVPPSRYEKSQDGYHPVPPQWFLDKKYSEGRKRKITPREVLDSVESQYQDDVQVIVQTVSNQMRI